MEREDGGSGVPEPLPCDGVGLFCVSEIMRAGRGF